jgi:DNA-binding Lrp family transcriptional regulator
MMTQAYILLNVEGGTEDNVLKQVKKIAGVEQAHVSYGVYDIIIKVKTQTMQELKDVVTHKIRQIKSVQSTLTLLMVEE